MGACHSMRPCQDCQAGLRGFTCIELNDTRIKILKDHLWHTDIFDQINLYNLWCALIGASVGCLTTTRGSFLILFSRLHIITTIISKYFSKSNSEMLSKWRQKKALWKLFSIFKPMLEPGVVHPEPCSRVDPMQLLSLDLQFFL